MRYLLIGACFGLAACATQPATGPAPDSGDDGDRSVISDGTSTSRTLTRTVDGDVVSIERVKDFLPFIDVAMDPGAVNAITGTQMVDKYTRLRIETLNPKATDMSGTASGAYTNREADRDYRRESRSWLSRMLSSKTVNRTLMAEFELRRPNVKSTQALFSASFSSNRQDGETWSTDQNLAVYATPWFKVSPNTTLTTKLRMQLADQRESYGASANVIGALNNAATLIAPTTPLLTFFNAPAMTDASNFLDASVSSLFGRAITEQSTGTMALKTWDEKPMLVVYAAMPDPRDIRRTKDRDMLGGWAVTLEEPILSVFTRKTQRSEDSWEDWPDYSSSASSDILGFDLDRNLTVYGFLYSNLGLADRIAELNELPETENARQLCNRMTRGLMSDAGLNLFDAAAVIYAAASSDMMTAEAQAVLTHPTTCSTMDLYQKLSGEAFPELMGDEGEEAADTPAEGFAGLQ